MGLLREALVCEKSMPLEIPSGAQLLQFHHRKEYEQPPASKDVLRNGWLILQAEKQSG